MGKAETPRIDMPMRMDSEFRFRMDEGGTFARRLYRRDFNLVSPTRAGESPESVARDFLTTNAARLGLGEGRGKTPIAQFEAIRTVGSGYSQHVTFQQMVGDVPVFRGEVVVNLTNDNVVYSVYNEHQGEITIDVTPSVTTLTARDIAISEISPSRMMGEVKSNLYVMDVDGASTLVHRVTVPADQPLGDWVVVVDARTGAILSVHDQAVYDTGTGQLFDPDPKTKLNDDTLTDQNDADIAIPVGGYDTYPLPLLDPPVGGLYSLAGPWAIMIDNETPTIAPPTEADANNFVYTRSPDEFENVLCYWHITNMQTYFQDTLGLSNVNQRQQGLDAHGLSGADNSHYVLSTGNIAYGDGGVDDAEDADVVIHEYGHAIQHDQVPSWGGGDADRMGEGFGDYLAVSYSLYKNPTFQTDFVFNWDGHNEFWAGRLSIDSTLHYPESNSGVHTPGGTLWCSSIINGLLVIGRNAMDGNVLQSHFALGASATMPDAANEVVNADILLNGGANVQALVTIFDFWGMLDASTFLPTITHTPLTDTEDEVGPYTIVATITAAQPLDFSATEVIYGTTGSFTDTLVMAATANPNEFSADIPGPLSDVDVQYYITATDSGGGTATDPAGAPGSFHQFHVGGDIIPPVIVHTALNDQPWIRWPSTLTATITDNLGVNDDSVYVEWSHNSVPQADFPLLRVGVSDVFTGDFPSDTTMAIIGDLMEYRILARDNSTNENQTIEPAAGTHAFKLVDVLGVLLVLDDDEVPKENANVKRIKGDDGYYEIMSPARDLSKAGKTASEMATILTDLGYDVTVEGAGVSDPLTWPVYDFIVSSSGKNTAPVAIAQYRTDLENYVAGGGKLIVEGGEVGFDAISTPGYPTFAANVLHGNAWTGDNVGNLNTVAGQVTHPIVTTPNAIPSPLTMNYVGFGDEDAVSVADAATYVVMETATDPGDGGVIVFDDNPAPQSAQIVFYAFDFSIVADSATRSQLLENTATFLLAAESPPTGSITGNVNLTDSGDNSGVVVTAGSESDMTDGAGNYLINNLYAATYNVTATKSNYSVGLVSGVVVTDNTNTPNIDFALSPIAIDTVCITPGLVINDNDSLWTTIALGPYTVSEIDLFVDITHTFIGDLRVRLTSPTGTSVVVHNRTGSTADDILTTYDAVTAPDGPGTMDDFIGEFAVDKWFLSITDNATFDTGTLNEACLYLTRAVAPTGVDGALIPGTFALRPNTPNPFNPTTRIRFDLPRRAPVTLNIYSSSGRLVRRLLNEKMDAGAQQVIWDGQNDAGQTVSSGVYFIRIEAEEFARTRKMTLIR